jgi:hypothetical protein
METEAEGANAEDGAATSRGPMAGELARPAVAERQCGLVPRACSPPPEPRREKGGGGAARRVPRWRNQRGGGLTSHVLELEVGVIRV